MNIFLFQTKVMDNFFHLQIFDFIIQEITQKYKINVNFIVTNIESINIYIEYRVWYTRHQKN